MPISHKIIGILNLMILPVLLFLAYNASAFIGFITTTIGIISILIPIAILTNIGTMNLIKYYRTKPYQLGFFEKPLLWAAAFNGLLFLAIAIPILINTLG